MQRTAGQFTYLPNDLRSKTDNSFELLRLVPLLDVSDRGISIFGKGASRIFINGRDPHDRTRGNHGDAARDASFAYSPNRDNNSARSRYSAADNRGIVNVVLSNPYEGIRGSTTASASIRQDAWRYIFSMARCFKGKVQRIGKLFLLFQ